MALRYAWSDITPSGTKPSIRAGHVSWVVGNYAYVFGGHIGYEYNYSTPEGTIDEGYNLVSDAFWSYDITTNMWTQLSLSGSVPQGRTGAAAWTVGSDLYLFGGLPGNDSTKTALSDFWHYNSTTQTWTEITLSTKPPARGFAAFWSYDHNLYLAGGSVYTIGAFGSFVTPNSLKDVWVFSTTTQTWTQLPDAYSKFEAGPAWVLGATAFINNGLHSYGGALASDGSIFEFDCLTNTWISDTPSVFRFFATAGTLNNKGFLISGMAGKMDYGGPQQSTIIYEQNLSNQIVPIPFDARCQATTWSTSDKLYLFGGGTIDDVSIYANYSDLWCCRVVPPTISLSLDSDLVIACSNRPFDFHFNLSFFDTSSDYVRTKIHLNESDQWQSDCLPGLYNISLIAPSTASDYTVTITAQDPGYISASSVKIVTVKISSITINEVRTELPTGYGYDPNTHLAGVDFCAFFDVTVQNPLNKYSDLRDYSIVLEFNNETHHFSSNFWWLKAPCSDRHTLRLKAYINENSDCSATSDIVIDVISLEINAGSDQYINPGDDFIQIGQEATQDGATYSWSSVPFDPTTTDQNVPNIYVSPPTTTLYTVTASSGNCHVSDSVTVHVSTIITLNTVSLSSDTIQTESLLTLTCTPQIINGSDSAQITLSFSDINSIVFDVSINIPHTFVITAPSVIRRTVLPLTVTAVDKKNPSATTTLSYQITILPLSPVFSINQEIPVTVFPHHSFDISFLVSEQNGGIAATSIHWLGSDYNVGTVDTTGGKFFWNVCTNPFSPQLIYTAEFNSYRSDQLFNENSVTVQPSQTPSSPNYWARPFSIDFTNKIIYVAASNSENQYILFKGSIDLVNTSDITLTPIAPFRSASRISALFFDELTNMLYWADDDTTSIYVSDITRFSDAISQNRAPLLSVSGWLYGLYIDSINNILYFSGSSMAEGQRGIFAASLSNPSSYTCIQIPATSTLTYGFFLNKTIASLYWVTGFEDNSNRELWKGTLSDLGVPSRILTSDFIGSFYNTDTPTSLNGLFYPTCQTYSLPAPAAGGDYTVTITAYDSDNPTCSTIVSDVVHVVGLSLSDGLDRHIASTGDPYTITWTGSIVNQPPCLNPVVTLTRPEGLSTQHYGFGLLQDFAPMLPGDYGIVVQMCLSDYCISDVLTLKVRWVAVEAGSDQPIPYGQSVRLGSRESDPDVVYSWDNSDTLDNPSCSYPLATPKDTTTYIVTGIRSDIGRSASDHVTISVFAPITLSDVRVTPSYTCPTSSLATFSWSITTSDPPPHYTLTLIRPNDEPVTDTVTSLSGSRTDTLPHTPGIYPYTFIAQRTGYGFMSDQATVFVHVVKPHLVVSDLDPTPTSDPYDLFFTVYALGGDLSDHLTVTVVTPTATLVSDCINGVPYVYTFQAPNFPGTYPITLTAVHPLGCSDYVSRRLTTKWVTVNAGPDRILVYGSDTLLGKDRQEPDISYTWSPAYGLSSTSDLYTIASPRKTTTYKVVASRSDVGPTILYASDAVTVTVVAPLTLSSATVTPSPTYPGSPLTFSWSLPDNDPWPYYHTRLTRSDGSVLYERILTSDLSDSVSDSAPLIPGRYLYTLTVIRSDYGQLSDQRILPVEITQVVLSDVQAVINPTPSGDPYQLQWTAFAQNPQSDEYIHIIAAAPSDFFYNTFETFFGYYKPGQSAHTTFIAPDSDSDFWIGVFAYDDYGSWDFEMLPLSVRAVSVRAGTNRPLPYGTSTTLGDGIEESGITYTWYPSDDLSSPTGLHPIASPRSDRTYTVTATRIFPPHTIRQAQDSVTLTVVAPIPLTEVYFSPAITCLSASPVTLHWSISSDDPPPFYRATLRHSDGSFAWGQDWTSQTGSVTSPTFTTPGTYTYDFYVERHNYGKLSDHKQVSLRVLKPYLAVNVIPNPTPTSDSYYLHWTVSDYGGSLLDRLHVILYPPDAEPIDTIVFPGTHTDERIAPPISSDYRCEAWVYFEDLPSCSDRVEFWVRVRTVSVNAGSDQDVIYGHRVQLGDGPQEPDITYTWNADSSLDLTEGLHPVAAPLHDTTYTVTASRVVGSDTLYASDSVTLTVIAPVFFQSVSVAPNPTAPGQTLTWTWELSDNSPHPPSYTLQIHASDGALVFTRLCSDLQGTATILGPTTPLRHYYQITATRTDFGQRSDQRILPVEVTQVYFSDVHAVTNPAPTGDPYLFEWTVCAQNPQPNEFIHVYAIAPSDVYYITPNIFDAYYPPNGSGRVQFNAPSSEGFYPIGVLAFDDFGSSDYAIVMLQTRFVTVNAGEDRSIWYGSDTQLGDGIQESDIFYHWIPASALDRSDILKPKASPKITTPYTVIATRYFHSDWFKQASDRVTVFVEAPLYLSDVSLTPTPSCLKDETSITVRWYVLPLDPPLQYWAILYRPDGGVAQTIITSDTYGVVSDSHPLLPGAYPYTLVVQRLDYGNTSDFAMCTLHVVQPHITAQTLLHRLSARDLYQVEWTPSVIGGTGSDYLTVILQVPNASDFVTHSQPGITHQTPFTAPAEEGTYEGIAVVLYSDLPSCSDRITFAINVYDVAVEAGSDQTIDYGTSVILGVGPQESDIVYTWSPAEGLNTTHGLHPIATPLRSNTYTVLAYRSDIHRYASDVVTITVTAPIELDVGWIT